MPSEAKKTGWITERQKEWFSVDVQGGQASYVNEKFGIKVDGEIDDPEFHKRLSMHKDKIHPQLWTNFYCAVNDGEFIGQKKGVTGKMLESLVMQIAVIHNTHKQEVVVRGNKTFMVYEYIGGSARLMAKGSITDWLYFHRLHDKNESDNLISPYIIQCIKDMVMVKVPTGFAPENPNTNQAVPAENATPPVYVTVQPPGHQTVISSIIGAENQIKEWQKQTAFTLDQVVEKLKHARQSLG